MRYDQQDPDDAATWEIFALVMIVATLIGLVVLIVMRATGRL